MFPLWDTAGRRIISELNNEWSARLAEYPAPYSRDYAHPVEYY